MMHAQDESGVACSVYDIRVVRLLIVYCFVAFSSFFASCPVIHALQSQPLNSLNSLTLAQTTQPVIVVENLHQALINIMKNADLLGWQGRYDQLQAVLRQAYDFSGMTRIAAGSHWKAFTELQKANMIEAFCRLSIATYASRFKDYRGERFETIKVEELPQTSPSVIVRTKLITTDDRGVELSYRLRIVKGVWKIVDVFYRGTISELANKRAQYLTVLNQSGYEKLLQRMHEKIKQLSILEGDLEAGNDVP